MSYESREIHTRQCYYTVNFITFRFQCTSADMNSLIGACYYLSMSPSAVDVAFVLMIMMKTAMM